MINAVFEANYKQLKDYLFIYLFIVFFFWLMRGRKSQTNDFVTSIVFQVYYLLPVHVRDLILFGLATSFLVVYFTVEQLPTEKLSMVMMVLQTLWGAINFLWENKVEAPEVLSSRTLNRLQDFQHVIFPSLSPKPTILLLL